MGKFSRWQSDDIFPENKIWKTQSTINSFITYLNSIFSFYWVLINHCLKCFNHNAEVQICSLVLLLYFKMSFTTLIDVILKYFFFFFW